MSSHDNNAMMTDNDDELFLGWVTDVFIDDVGANQLPPFHFDSQFQPQFQSQSQSEPRPQPQSQLDPEPLWTEEENKAFKTLVTDSFAEVMENRWEAVAPRLPGKTPEQLIKHLDKLLKDVSVIKNHVDTTLQQNNNLVSSNNPIMNGITLPYLIDDHQYHSLDQFQANPWEATMNSSQNYSYPIPPLNNNVNNNAAFQENNLVSMPIMNGATPPYFTDHQHQRMEEEVVVAAPVENVVAMEQQNQPENQAMCHGLGHTPMLP
ncbi:hypothetical protein PIB30_076429 [Stylosanthes scabra]|uniref:Myb-like domain-containing protein n=1 Tax=Stylosanthes scabra TaxID=79078 RepID=A0ABU6QSK2_9FABA|nr:hypothetical protein [Stylosanthes scabra]